MTTDDATGRKSRWAPAMFFAGLCLVLIGAFAVNTRYNGIFACAADGYSGDHYLGYCQATAYGDYDHGAVWFDLEPRAVAYARNADVLFLGNSRTQFGFSTPAMGHWFSRHDQRHYLLGFSHTDNVAFVAPLLERLAPRARAYVINVDDFFATEPTLPAREVMHTQGAERRYSVKRLWQRVHRRVCDLQPQLCGDALAFYRQRETGEWQLARFGGLQAAPIVTDAPFDGARIAQRRAVAERFITQLGAPRSCIILTYVPQPYNQREDAAALAAALGIQFVSPQLSGLMTFDSSHLDRASAERFTQAFLEAADPALRACLDAQPASAPSQ